MDDTGHTRETAGTENPGSPIPDDDALARERARRIETLHRLALAAEKTQPSQPPGPATTLPPLAPAPSAASPAAAPGIPRSPRRRFAWWIAAGAAVLCLAVLAGLILHAGQQPPHQVTHATAPGPAIVRPALDGLTCLSDAAWSPHGDRVAIIGSAPTGSCPGTGLLDIYDTAGKVTARLRPDQAVLAALTSAPGAPGPSGGVPTISYSHILWSSDATTLALTGFVDFPDVVPPATAPNVTFLELAPVDGRRAVASLVSSSDTIPGVLWTLSGTPTGTILPSRSPLAPLGAGVGYASPVTPASLSYQWSSSGTLTPMQPLFAQFTPPAPPLGPVGNPARDAQFTVWQPGHAELQFIPRTGEQPQATVGVGVYTWTTGFAAWSPDGRYLLDSVSVLDRIQPPGLPDATPQRVDDLGLTGIPLLPLRDAALDAIFARMQTGTIDTPSQHIALAWRPDGHVLAATSLLLQFTGADANVNTPAQPSVVTLYDCATGHDLATLPIPSYNITSPFDSSLLRWSADGAHLLLYEASTTTIVLWGPGELPRG